MRILVGTSDSTGFVPAFVCMEGENGVPKDDFQKCAAQHNLDAAKVMPCANMPQFSKALLIVPLLYTQEILILVSC